MKGARTTDLQIRGIPTALRDRIRVRAAKKGQTMSQYMIGLAQRDTDELSLDEWLDLAARQPPTPDRGIISAADAVREAREERAEHLAEVAAGRRKKASS